jgi:galactonate dehydratase
MVVALHNANSTLATMTALHAAATLPNLLVVETFNDFDERWVWDALPGLPPLLEGHLALPEAPGIGVEPNEDALAAHPPKATFMDMNVAGWEMRHAVVD